MFKCKHDYQSISDTWMNSFDALEHIAGIKESVEYLKEKYYSYYNERFPLSYLSHIIFQYHDGSGDGKEYRIKIRKRDGLEQKVCLRCGHCIDQVKEETEAILARINKIIKKEKEYIKRKKLAKRMWKNCKGNSK